jgi:hypothetical protein
VSSPGEGAATWSVDIFLRCSEWEAADLLVRHLDDVLPILTRKADVWIRFSVDTSPHLSFEWQ